MLDFNKNTNILRNSYEVIKSAFEFGTLSSEDYYKNIYKTVKDNEGLIKDTIFEFFDNDLFIPCNGDKRFSYSDMAAVIVHSRNKTLNEKIEALTDIKSASDDPILNEEIDEWINAKRYYLDFICKIKNEIVIFMEKYDRFVSNPKMYSSFERALNSGMHFHQAISLECIDDEMEGTLMLVSFVNPNMSKHQPKDSISDISLVARDIKRIFPEFDSKSLRIYKRTVELDHPFNEFDFLEINGYPDFIKYVVIGNKNQEIKESHDRVSPGWLKLNIENYYLETTPFNDKGIKPGEVTSSQFFTYVKTSLGGIKLMNREMTIYQKEYVDEIKKQLNVI